MGSLRIPERYRTGVASIASLTDASFNDLVQALKSSSLGETASDLAAKLEAQVPSIPLSKRAALIAAIASMQGVQKAAHTDAAKFVSDAWPSALPLILKEMKSTPGHWFWALDAIAQGENPAQDCETLSAATKAWIEWGESKGIL